MLSARLDAAAPDATSHGPPDPHRLLSTRALGSPEELAALGCDCIVFGYACICVAQLFCRPNPLRSGSHSCAHVAL